MGQAGHGGALPRALRRLWGCIDGEAEVREPGPDETRQVQAAEEEARPRQAQDEPGEGRREHRGRPRGVAGLRDAARFWGFGAGGEAVSSPPPSPWHILSPNIATGPRSPRGTFIIRTSTARPSAACAFIAAMPSVPTSHVDVRCVDVMRPFLVREEVDGLDVFDRRRLHELLARERNRLPRELAGVEDQEAR